MGTDKGALGNKTIVPFTVWYHVQLFKFKLYAIHIEMLPTQTSHLLSPQYGLWPPYGAAWS